MRQILLVAIMLLMTGFVFSQENTSSKNRAATWEKGGTFSATLSQGGTRNWAPGGDRFTLATNGFLYLYANRTRNKWTWKNSIEANYGLINTNSTGIIKNDDKLELLSQLSYSLGNNTNSNWRIAGLLNFRTQFADGYDYDSSVKKKNFCIFSSRNLCPFSGRSILFKR